MASSQERLKLLLSTLSQAAEPLAPLAGLYALRLGTWAEDENGRRLGAGAERRGFSLVWDLFCVAGGLTYHQQRIGRVFCRGPRFFCLFQRIGCMSALGSPMCDPGVQIQTTNPNGTRHMGVVVKNRATTKWFALVNGNKD